MSPHYLVKFKKSTTCHRIAHKRNCKWTSSHNTNLVLFLRRAETAYRERHTRTKSR